MVQQYRPGNEQWHVHGPHVIRHDGRPHLPPLRKKTCRDAYVYQKADHEACVRTDVDKRRNKERSLEPSPLQRHEYRRIQHDSCGLQHVDESVQRHASYEIHAAAVDVSEVQCHALHMQGGR